MEITAPVKKAIFLRRPNLFTAVVESEGKEEAAHLPSSGRMKELLVPGSVVYLVDRAGARRKTKYDLVMVSLGELLVWVDSRTSSRLVQEALSAKSLPQFRACHFVSREALYHGARLDLLLAEGSRHHYLEVKSVTLVRERKALFPDAPTPRGTRQLEALMEARGEGLGASIVFVIQRHDAEVFSPNEVTDPRFAQALRQAVRNGVGVYAYRYQVGCKRVELDGEITVLL